MTTKVGVLIVEDHSFVAHATESIILKSDRFEVLGVCYTGKSCLHFIEQQRPELILLDYLLPDISGKEVARLVKSKYPDTHVVIFTGEDVKDLLPIFLDIRVSGIISKGTRADTLHHMLACMMDGHIVLPYETYMHSLRLQRNKFEEFDLTEQDIEIMHLVVKGETHEQIADQIHVSKRSVDNYLRKIYEKMGASTKLQALEKFVQSPFYKDPASPTM